MTHTFQLMRDKIPWLYHGDTVAMKITVLHLLALSFTGVMMALRRVLRSCPLSLGVGETTFIQNAEYIVGICWDLC